jgi:nucleosome binding factor SPN SPT16 subunit
LRKLSPSERIIEPARLILRHDGNVNVLARTAAAAIIYMGIRKENKAEVKNVLINTCGLQENEKLYKQITAYLNRSY